jgi:hypothetical protein
MMIPSTPLSSSAVASIFRLVSLPINSVFSSIEGVCLFWVIADFLIQEEIEAYEMVYGSCIAYEKLMYKSLCLLLTTLQGRLLKIHI